MAVGRAADRGPASVGEEMRLTRLRARGSEEAFCMGGRRHQRVSGKEVRKRAVRLSGVEVGDWIVCFLLIQGSSVR